MIPQQSFLCWQRANAPILPGTDQPFHIDRRCLWEVGQSASSNGSFSVSGKAANPYGVGFDDRTILQDLFTTDSNMKAAV